MSLSSEGCVLLDVSFFMNVLKNESLFDSVLQHGLHPLWCVLYSYTDCLGWWKRGGRKKSLKMIQNSDLTDKFPYLTVTALELLCYKLHPFSSTGTLPMTKYVVLNDCFLCMCVYSVLGNKHFLCLKKR
jgi:hypothetical protein